MRNYNILFVMAMLTFLLLKSLTQFDQVKIVERHVVSVASEDEHQAILADLHRVSITGCWLDVTDNTEVVLCSAWRALHCGTLSSERILLVRLTLLLSPLHVEVILVE